MNRREAIKNLSLGIGYIVSVPTVMGVIQSCSQEKVSWTPQFFNTDQQHLVNHLVDIILPPTEIPGGLDLNLPQFVDKMCDDLLTDSDKESFQKGSEVFSSALTKGTGKSMLEAGKSEIEDTFSGYFDLPVDDQTAVLEAQSKGDEGLDKTQLESFVLYKCLFTIREFTLLGYFSSENIGKEVLSFDPIPGGYKPCIPIEEVGNAWTIG